MQGLVFLLNYKKRIILSFVLITLISVLLNYIINTNIVAYVEYSLPNALITDEKLEVSEDEVIPIANYNLFEYQDITTNVRGIDLQNLGFIKDNSEQMKRNVQDALNGGTTAVNQTFASMYDSDTFNQYQINIPLKTLDLDHVIVGQYPEDNQALISEAFATELINSDQSLNNYDDLVGYEYQGFNISGVYASSNLSLADEIIVATDQKPQETANLILNYSSQTVDDLESNDIPYITSKTFKSINIKLYCKLLIITLSQIILYILIRKEIKEFNTICLNNNVKVGIIRLNVAIVLIILVLIDILIVIN